MYFKCVLRFSFSLFYDLLYQQLKRKRGDYKQRWLYKMTLQPSSLNLGLMAGGVISRMAYVVVVVVELYLN